SNEIGRPTSIHPMEVDYAPRLGFAWQPFGSAKWVIRSAYGIFYTYPNSNDIVNTMATVPFDPFQTVFNDRPPSAPSRTWSDFFLGQPGASANPSPGRPCSFGFAANSCDTPDLDTSALDLRTTYVQQWNFSVQRQLSAATSFEMAYVGAKSTHVHQTN